MDQKSSPFGNGAATREIRSASLRFVVPSILFANLVFCDGLASFTTHVIVNSVYLIVSVASVAAAIYFPKQMHLGPLFVMLDAALVVVILYEHILANPITQDHNLTTSSLVVSFILLNHVALKLDRWLIIVFSTIVVSAWVLMLAIMAFRHHDSSPGTLLANFFNQDLGLTVSFAFTAMAVYLLARDHDRTVRQALRIEEKRMNLSRFFSPTVVADLQTASASLTSSGGTRRSCLSISGTSRPMRKPLPHASSPASSVSIDTSSPALCSPMAEPLTSSSAMG